MKNALAILAASVAMAGCASMSHDGPAAGAKLESTKGNNAAGSVTFTQKGDKVLMVGNVSGLKAGQMHGFHIHEKGDCSSGDGMSAGGHFNPFSKSHGAFNEAEHHAGDLPSLKADDYGNAAVEALLEGVTVADGPGSVVGRGLIVHLDADDFKTQPTGNSGPRIACGVIQKK